MEKEQLIALYLESEKKRQQLTEEYAKLSLEEHRLICECNSMGWKVWDPDRSVAWNIQESKRQHNSIRGKRATVTRALNELNVCCENATVQYLITEYKLPNAVARFLFSEAREAKHGEGHNAILDRAEYLAEIAAHALELAEL